MCKRLLNVDYDDNGFSITANQKRMQVLKVDPVAPVALLFHIYIGVGGSHKAVFLNNTRLEVIYNGANPLLHQHAYELRFSSHA